MTSSNRQAPDGARLQPGVVREYFDRESDAYMLQRYRSPGPGRSPYEERKAIALRMLEGERGDLLDAGCGPAAFTRELLAAGFRVRSTDLSFKMLRTARDVVGASSADRTDFAQGELGRLPFRAGSFDCILCMGVLGYLERPAEGLRDLHRVLKPGGVAVVQLSNLLCPTQAIHRRVQNVVHLIKGSRPSVEYPAHRLTRLSPRAFRRLLIESEFEIEAMAAYDFNPPLLEILSPALAGVVAERLRVLAGSQALGWLAEGMIAKVRRR
jgi:SAM-dependent methyltransferase